MSKASFANRQTSLLPCLVYEHGKSQHVEPHARTKSHETMPYKIGATKMGARLRSAKELEIIK